MVLHNSGLASTLSRITGESFAHNKQINGLLNHMNDKLVYSLQAIDQRLILSTLHHTPIYKQLLGTLPCVIPRTITPLVLGQWGTWTDSSTQEACLGSPNLIGHGLSCLLTDWRGPTVETVSVHAKADAD